MTFDGQAFGLEIVSAVKEHMAAVLAPLQDELGKLKADVAGLAAANTVLRLQLEEQPSFTDVSKDLETLQGSVDAVVAMPRLEPEKAMGELQARMALVVQEHVQRELAGWPRPQDGKVGERGEAGPRGEKGEMGSIGRDGRDPDMIAISALIGDATHKAVSERWAQMPMPKDGLNGKDGAPGLHGKDGAPGLNGKDGANGLDGKDGADGLNGKDGADGMDGKDGKDGAPGPQGERGEPGLQGEKGLDGVAGENGLNGKDGSNGIDGKDGSDGNHGWDGAPGLDGKDGAPGLNGMDAEPVTKDQIVEVVLSLDAVPVAVQQYLRENPPAAGIDGKDGANGLNGKDGLDFVQFVRDVDGHLIGTLSNGSVKDLGEIDGQDGAPGRDGVDGRDGRDANLSDVEKLFDEKAATIQPVVVEAEEEYAPSELAQRISHAVKMMAERPVLEPIKEHAPQLAPINIHLPQMAAPTIVEMPAPVVNVTLPDREKRKTRTVVKGHDANGRITEFEQEET